MSQIDDLVLEINKESDIVSKTKLIKQGLEKYDIKSYELAGRLGMFPSHLSSLLRLLKLPEIVIDGYYSQTVSVSHLIILSRLHDESEMIKLYEKILSESLSVIQLENEVRRILYNISGGGNKLKKEYINRIQDSFKKINPEMSVSLVQTRIKAKLTVELKGNIEDTTKAFEEWASQ